VLDPGMKRRGTARVLPRVTTGGALPLLVVRVPVFPGQVIDLRLSWDFERAAIDTAIAGRGQVALCPDWNDAGMMSLRAGAGRLLGTVAEVVGTTLRGDGVRLRAIERILVTSLDLPPKAPAAEWEPFDDAAPEPLFEIADAVRSAFFWQARARGDQPPVGIWTAAPGELADTVAPVAFHGDAEGALRAFSAPVSQRLAMVLAKLLETAGWADRVDPHVAAELVVLEWMNSGRGSDLKSESDREER
jgi:hypothetical protein